MPIPRAPARHQIPTLLPLTPSSLHPSFFSFTLLSLCTQAHQPPVPQLLTISPCPSGARPLAEPGSGRPALSPSPETPAGILAIDPRTAPLWCGWGTRCTMGAFSGQVGAVNKAWAGCCEHSCGSDLGRGSFGLEPLQPVGAWQRGSLPQARTKSQACSFLAC